MPHDYIYALAMAYRNNNKKPHKAVQTILLLSISGSLIWVNGKVDSSTILAKIDSDADSTSRFTVIDKPIRGILMLVMMIMSVILEKQY